MKISKRTLLYSLLYLAALLACDSFSKFWTFENIAKMSWLYPSYPYGGIAVFKNFLGISFSLNYVQNTGSAWGLFSDYQIPLFIARSLLVGALIIYQLFFLKKQYHAFALTMVISGAIGNLVDVVLYGHVIDMFHFNLWGYHYPVFNIADMSICIGVVWLIIYSIRDSIRDRRTNAH
ncbi:MAG: signal peptidase II [Rhabdochlamydiaceae bacterium]|nr:signal peptidase II [Candidatus Amphrikana amoebophyrae]